MKKKFTCMEQIKFYLVKRFLLKSVLPFVLAALISYAAGNPQWIALAPVFMTLEKYLRDKGYWFNY